MHVTARRALRPISRRRARAPLLLPYLDSRSFHSTSNSKNEAKPSEESAKTPSADGETREGRVRKTKGNEAPPLKSKETTQDETGFLESLLAKVRETVNSIGSQNQEATDVSKEPGSDAQSKVQEAKRVLERHPRLARLDSNSLDLERATQTSAHDFTNSQKVGENTTNVSESKSSSDGRPRRKGYGQRSRSKAPEALPLELPSWFLEQNLKLYSPSTANGVQHPKKGPETIQERLDEWAAMLGGVVDSVSRHEPKTQVAGPFSACDIPNIDGSPLISSDMTKQFYVLFERFIEIYAGVVASFTVARLGTKPVFTVPKANLLLTCPLGGTTLFLQSVVNAVASEVEADVLQINAQDIAELAALNLRLLKTMPDIQKLANLGYEIYTPASTPQERPDAEEDEAEEDHQLFLSVDELGDRNKLAQRIQEAVGRLNRGKGGRSPDAAPDKDEEDLSLHRFFNGLIEASYAQKMKAVPDASSLPGFEALASAVSKSSAGAGSILRNAQALKLPSTDDSSSESKLTPASAEPEIPPSPIANGRKLIVCVEDFESLGNTDVGRTVLRTLATVIEKRRRKFGEQLMIVGTAPSSRTMPSWDRVESADQEKFQNLDGDDVYRKMEILPLDQDKKVVKALSAPEMMPSHVGSSPHMPMMPAMPVMPMIAPFPVIQLGGPLKNAQDAKRMLESMRAHRASLETSLEAAKSKLDKLLGGIKPESPPLTIASSKIDEFNAGHEPIWNVVDRHQIQRINYRNFQETLRRLLALDKSFNFFLGKHINDLDSSDLTHYLHLDKVVLDEDTVFRIAMTAIGLHEITKGNINMADIHYAAWLLQHSDRNLAFIDRLRSPPNAEASPAEQHARLLPNAAEDRIRRLQMECNNHEKKLLGGVVHPEKLTVGFDDVHVPADTIEALKTMTSLSFTRPDAFQYGILKSDSLSGLLMYGPPGTGKTMLAKAVAKDSGATVLKISGSEINQKYVGEGEKAVKAVFTLAQRLSPCIVFIDEADSMLASRSGQGSHRGHHDTINQFLLEWDGMNERNVFIMVATNRPFDLDEAVLRRLPRRLLVELPTKEDRAAILKIHLREEVLDGSVSLENISERTPFYSGSDLKNLAVSAALACVKEENEAATKARAGGEMYYKYPDKRTLSKEHFDKALGDIAASISEDMPTLTAIRKFDEQFGDRKGRKKKTSWGFGVQEAAKENAARVRG